MASGFFPSCISSNPSRNWVPIDVSPSHSAIKSCFLASDIWPTLKCCIPARVYRFGGVRSGLFSEKAAAAWDLIGVCCQKGKKIHPRFFDSSKAWMYICSESLSFPICSWNHARFKGYDGSSGDSSIALVISSIAKSRSPSCQDTAALLAIFIEMPGSKVILAEKNWSDSCKYCSLSVFPDALASI